MSTESADRPPAGAEPPAPAEARSAEQIQRAHKLESLGQLAHGVAHDINNVLGVILGYVELAKMKLSDADPKVVRHLEMALSTLGRARTLADRLMEFAREDRRSADASDLNDTVQHVREMLAETLDRQLTFEVKLGASVPPTPLETAQLQQLIMNLCLNAAEAMPRGGRLTLSTCLEELAPGRAQGLAPGTYAVLRVSDTGPGVPADLLGRIFEPYFTSHGATRSGLGLWVVRGLAEKFGGRVDVGGDEHGAVFTVRLPSKLSVQGRASAARTPLPADPEGRAPAALVVDDEPGLREILRAFLEVDGYRVSEAGTGARALELLRAEPGAVRLVFLDHLLPDARGAELAWQIAEMEAAPKLVMVTGLAGLPETLDLPAGTRVLPKPFLHDDVRRLLAEVAGL